MKVFFGLSLMKTNQAQKVELLDRNMQNLETLSIKRRSLTKKSTKKLQTLIGVSDNTQTNKVEE